MHLRDTDSWLPVAILAAFVLVAIPACLPKDTDDNKSGGSGYWDSGWDSYDEYNEFDDDSESDAATIIEDIPVNFNWDMTRDGNGSWDFAGHSL